MEGIAREQRSLTVLVCRGCCCGTARKHPEIDHASQLARLRVAAAAAGAVKVIATDCLGPCDRSNVVVLRGSVAAGCSTVWLERILGDEVTEALVELLRSSDPRLDDLPDRLRTARFDPDSLPVNGRRGWPVDAEERRCDDQSVGNRSRDCDSAARPMR